MMSNQLSLIITANLIPYLNYCIIFVKSTQIKGSLSMIIRSANSGDLSAHSRDLRGGKAVAAGDGHRPMAVDMLLNADSVRTDNENGTGCVLVGKRRGDRHGCRVCRPRGDIRPDLRRSWRTDAPVYGIIHRVAGGRRRQKTKAPPQIHGLLCGPRPRGRRSIPARDTHADNATMQHTLEKNGYIRCGLPFIWRTARRASATSACCETSAFRVIFAK